MCSWYRIPPCPGRRAGRLGAVVLALALAWGQAGAAETYHVSPGAPAGDGSEGAPWGSVSAAFASQRLAGGDTLLLHPGRYGDIEIDRARFDQPVELRAQPRGAAHATFLGLTGTRNLIVDGLAIWPLEGTERGGSLVVEQGTNTVLRHLDVRSRADATDYRAWSLKDWLRDRRDGVKLMGRNATLERSHLTGLRGGVSVLGTGGRVLDNTIRGFSADAMRGVGENGLFRGNLVADCVKVDDNHDDGFQAWSIGPDGRAGRGTLRGLTLDANTVLEWSGDNNPLRCKLQGIGLFDGMFADLAITNNVIVVTAYQGIAVIGARGARIVNNTVVHGTGVSRENPWIQLAPHKNGTPSTGNLVANNIAPRFLLPGGAQADNTVAANVVLVYPRRELAFDGPGGVWLKPGSTLSGTARGDLAPPTDHAGRPRDTAGGTDPGAFAGQP